MLGVDKKIYLLPCDSDFVCQLDPETNAVKNVGPNLKNEMYVQNKWQNGFSAADGSIYAVPLKASNVLCIKPHKLLPNGDPEVTLIGGPYYGMNKWESGALGPDGCMYVRTKQRGAKRRVLLLHRRFAPTFVN